MSNWKDIKYCAHPFEFNRFKSREVSIGDVALGGENPIRVQSMTTTNTMDTGATVAQSIRMIEAGCEYVRITAPSINEAKNLEAIKSKLRKKGYSTPLIADIHFTPNAAEVAARIVEKVRVNPGNYADKKKFQYTDYSDQDYKNELERIHAKFSPLVKVCKEYGTAMRIGTNHGSLSDRILSRFGDTPLGMVESALEFVNICREYNYHNLVLSMKASNTLVMVEAYRLLVNRMMLESMNYPLHLGVTEAGEGEDGRIKSAVGIGTLLEDGLGDTIRVSLTEEPELEIPIAKALVSRYSKRANSESDFQGNYVINPFDYEKRKSKEILNIGNEHVPVVVGDINDLKQISQTNLFALGYQYSVPLDKWNIQDQAADYVYTADTVIEFDVPGTLSLIYDYNTWLINKGQNVYPMLRLDQMESAKEFHAELNFIKVTDQQINEHSHKQLKALNVVLVLDTDEIESIVQTRKVMCKLLEADWNIPVIIKRNYSEKQNESVQLYSASDFGAMLIDGLGDGIWLEAKQCSPEFCNTTSFGILQASRTRISKTEYISCPSCGRTLFDLQETTAKIRAKTHHLKGVKIGIMGCIVNGPGEMADADYGYVGSGPGKITLYKGHEVVQRNIATEHAVDALIELIKEHGDWIEKEKVLEA